MTHCHRPSTTTKLQQAGASDVDIAAFALWLNDDQHNCYQKLISPDVLAKEAGFANQTSYFLWRGQLSPEAFAPDMWRSVFPDADEKLTETIEVLWVMYFTFMFLNTFRLWCIQMVVILCLLMTDCSFLSINSQKIHEHAVRMLTQQPWDFCEGAFI